MGPSIIMKTVEIHLGRNQARVLILRHLTAASIQADVLRVVGP